MELKDYENISLAFIVFVLLAIVFGFVLSILKVGHHGNLIHDLEFFALVLAFLILMVDNLLIMEELRDIKKLIKGGG